MTKILKPKILISGVILFIGLSTTYGYVLNKDTTTEIYNENNKTSTKYYIFNKTNYLKCYKNTKYYNFENYEDIKLKFPVLLTNTNVYKDEINLDLQTSGKITNNLLNNIQKDFFNIQIFNPLTNSNLILLDINPTNISSLVYIDKNTKGLRLTQKAFDIINQKIEYMGLPKKELGTVTFNNELNTVLVNGGKDGQIVKINYIDLEKQLTTFYNRDNCDEETFNYNNENIKVVNNPTMLKEGGNHNLGNEIIGEYSMSFTQSSKESLQNIKTITNLVDGQIVKPGETLDLGKIVFSYGMNNYAESKIIDGGVIKTAPGGGLCGFATTLYRAVLNSGLEVNKRYGHSIYFNHIYGTNEIGLDSALFLWNKNLIFKNNTNGYLYLYSKYNDNTKTVSIKIFGNNNNKKIELIGPVINKVSNTNILVSWTRKINGTTTDIINTNYLKIEK